MLNNSTSPAILPMQCYMPCLSHGSLFSGIGGFDLAAQWMGWTNVFQCEKDDWCRKVLAKNFPKTERFADIKEFDATKYNGAIDIISGGFPCQPFSVSGKQRGKDDDRYLWEEMLRVIGEVEPSYIVGENVTGIIGMALDTVLADLEAQGYTTETFVIPACAKNAWHRRDRVWIVAYSGSARARVEEHRNSGQERQLSNTHQPKVLRQEHGQTGAERIDTGDREVHATKAEERRRLLQNAYGSRLEEHKLFNTGLFERPSGNGTSIEEQWAVEPELGRVAHGIPNRMDRIKGLGNAIVPQVAYEIFSAIGTVARHGI